MDIYCFFVNMGLDASFCASLYDLARKKSKRGGSSQLPIGMNDKGEPQCSLHSQKIWKC